MDWCHTCHTLSEVYLIFCRCMPLNVNDIDNVMLCILSPPPPPPLPSVVAIMQLGLETVLDMRSGRSNKSSLYKKKLHISDNYKFSSGPPTLRSASWFCSCGCFWLASAAFIIHTIWRAQVLLVCEFAVGGGNCKCECVCVCWFDFFLVMKRFCMINWFWFGLKRQQY